MNMIEAENLTKKFGETTAVDNLTFHVAEGEIFGLLGPNGAGKTTVIRMLCCLISRTSGEARIAGYQLGQGADSLAIRKLIGLVSSRMNDVRSAQQLGTLILLPFGAMYLLSELQVWSLTTDNMLIMTAGLVVIDGLVFYLVKATFQREEILTKWK